MLRVSKACCTSSTFDEWCFQAVAFTWDYQCTYDVSEDDRQNSDRYIATEAAGASSKKLKSREQLAEPGVVDLKYHSEWPRGESYVGHQSHTGKPVWGIKRLHQTHTRLMAFAFAGRGNEEALIPWADFLNHSSTSGSFLDFDPTSQSVLLRPSQAISQGAQIFASYGEKSNAELLLSYGFLLDSNVHDCYRLTLTIPLRDPVATRRPASQPPTSDQLVQEALSIPVREAKLAALKRLNRPRESTFPLRTSGTPEGLLQFAAFLAAGDKQGVKCADDVDRLAELLLGGAGFAGETVQVRGCHGLCHKSGVPGRGSWL